MWFSLELYSQNTIAEGVLHCEACVSCAIRSLANKPCEEPLCDDGGCGWSGCDCFCFCVLGRRRKCRVNHVELVRAYMCKHFLTVDMFTGLASAIHAAQKPQSQLHMALNAKCEVETGMI